MLACSLNKCVPRSAHVVVPQIQGTHYVAHTWQSIFPTHFYYGHSLVTNSHATQPGIIQNTATNTKFNIILLLYTGRLHSIDYSLFFLFSYSDWTNRLHKFQCTIKRGEIVS